jgi:dihydrofolate reductase
VSRTVVYFVACSLDGFIADAEGGVGWLEPFQAGDTDYGYADFLAEVGDVVMGRRTYERLLGFGVRYPYADKAGWVLSSDRTLERADESVTVTDEPAEGLVARLKYSDAEGSVWLVGGGALAGSLFDAGLIDEMRVFVMPSTLGEGIRMLGRPRGSRRLELVRVHEWTGGVVELRYVVGEAVDRP